MLQTLIETGKIPSKVTFQDSIEVPDTYYLSLEGKGSLEKILPKMRKQFEKLSHFAMLEKECKFFTIYHQADLQKDFFSYSACCSITHQEYQDYLVDDDYNFQPGELEANTYLQTTHK
jgi:hypothetical protein